MAIYAMNPAHKLSNRRPSRRQREFAITFVLTGNAAKAAREAGYKGRYAAQAGYKMLNRPGTIERILYWQRLERLVLRANLLRALVTLRCIVERKETPLRTQREAGLHLLQAARVLGVAHDPACQALTLRLQHKLPQWRRLCPRSWEEPDRGSNTAA